MDRDLVLYGATGFIGNAIAALAAERGLQPLISARSGGRLDAQAAKLGLESRVITLDKPNELDETLADAAVLLNCAGPFLHTFEPLVEACLRTGTHYLDLSSEPPVYKGVAQRSDRAQSSGVMIMNSVGFDVAATDCLAVHLANRLPGATNLTLAFGQRGPAGIPPGKLNTLIEMVPYGSTKQHRVDGSVVDASRRAVREFDFGEGPVEAALTTWGDIHLAHLSTGIPNIEDYIVLPDGLGRQMDMVDRVRPLFRLERVRRAAKRTMHGGSTAEERAATSLTVWGEVTDEEGDSAAARLHGPEAGLEWTSRLALAVVDEVLAGRAPAGRQTPGTAYGPDFGLDIDGVWREDVSI